MKRSLLPILFLFSVCAHAQLEQNINLLTCTISSPLGAESIKLYTNYENIKTLNNSII